MRLHEAQIATRSRMYMNSSREAFERGQMRAYGIPSLPEYPGGGSTRCLTNCRCSWLIEEVYDEEGELTGWNCTWVLDPPAEHCVDCQDYGAKWNPLFVAA